MGTLVDLSRIRADRRLQELVRSLDAADPPPPEHYGWSAETWVNDVVVSWVDDSTQARIGYVFGRPEDVYLRYADHVRIWRNTTPAELAVGLQSGVFPPADEVTP